MFLRRTDLAEHHKQQDVIDDLQGAGDEQRPAETGNRKQRAGDDRTGGRRKAARNSGDARRRSALAGVTTAMT